MAISTQQASDLFAPAQPDIVLNPSQSLALRRMIDAMKADDAIYSACPEVVRRCIADIVMPAYTTAEQEILDLEAARQDGLKLLERFAAKIADLEARLHAKPRAA